MAVVDYPESEEEEEVLILPPQETQYAVTPNLAKYTGGEMNFTRGAWSAFCSLEWRLSQAERIKIQSILDTVKSSLDDKYNIPFNFNQLLVSNLKAPLPLHVSLCGNIMFANNNDLTAFEQGLRGIAMKPFEVSFKPQLKVYGNRTCDNLFLTMTVDKGDEEVKALSMAINNELSKYKLHEKYWGKIGDAHVSIAQSFDNYIVKDVTTVLHLSKVPVVVKAAVDKYNAELQKLNKVLEGLAFENDMVISVSGFTLRKGRSNIYIPFAK